MTIERFTLGMMVMIFVLQVASLMMAPSERKISESLTLIGETLRMQAETLHHLIQRVGELERRVNGLRLPQVDPPPLNRGPSPSFDV